MLENWTLRSAEGITGLLLIYAGVALVKSWNIVPRRVLELPLLLGLIYLKCVVDHAATFLVTGELHPLGILHPLRTKCFRCLSLHFLYVLIFPSYTETLQTALICVT